MSTVVTVEYGLRYPNGPYNWTMQNATNLQSPEARDSIQKAYEDNLAAMGLQAGKIEWVQRTVETKYGEPEPLAEVDPTPVIPTEEPSE